MAKKHWRNSNGQRIRIGSVRLFDTECCCGDCTDWPSCLKSVEWHNYSSSKAAIYWPTIDGFDVEEAYVMAWGHGGSGGSGGATLGSNEAGGGGGGGEFILSYLGKVTPSIELIINSNLNGYASEVKQGFDTYVKALAGSNGTTGPNGAGGAGGTGGTLWAGGTSYPGGAGHAGVDTQYGGGGGGGAGERGAGGDAIEWIGGTGGGGVAGAGGTGGLDSGAPGSNFGGGGAGGYTGLDGGGGGSGRIRIGWWLPIELQLTLSGAGVGDFNNGECICESSDTGPCYQKVSVTWSNINGSYTLQQSSPGSTVFSWSAPIVDVNDYDDVSANGILIYYRLVKGRADPLDPLINIQEEEEYLLDWSVGLSCVDGRVSVNNISHGALTLMQRNYDPITGWGAWVNYGAVSNTIGPTIAASETDTACDGNTEITVDLLWGETIQDGTYPCQWSGGLVDEPGTAIVRVRNYEPIDFAMLSEAADIITTEDGDELE